MKANLCIETSYSLLHSTIRIEEVVKEAKSLGYDTLAITDDKLHGAFKFYVACKKYGIKPIIGLRIQIEDDSLILYAKNEIGYKELLKVSSDKEIRGLVKLDEISSNIIIVSDGTHIPDVNKYKDKDFYIGIRVDTLDYEMNLADKLYELNGKKLALSPVRYLRSEDYKYYLALRAIDLGKTLSIEDRGVGSNYLMSYEELENQFRSYPDAVAEAGNIANMVDFTYQYGKYQLPQYPLDEHNAKSYLRALCVKGLEKRLKGKLVDVNLYKKRILDELEMIDKMGYNDYFLIVWDLVAYAKKHDIFVGPGRGSAAGSLVSYVLGITNADPIEYELLFERFLNPERISMPDIDIDFPDDRRDEMLIYAKDKYSIDNIGLIVTFGTFAGRSALRDIAKVLEIDNNYLEEVLKYVPVNATNLSKYSKEDDLKRLINEYPDIQKLLEYASYIEGLPRHTSTHAAGVILTSDNLRNYSPMQKGMLGLYQTQYEAKDLETIGLLKMDFLGLRNLTILDRTKQLIKQNENIDINLYDLTYDDEDVFDLIGKADTYGVFQLESAGMRSLLKRLDVSEFEDVVAAIALHRPGPMENIPDYVDRKLGKKRISYIHNDLEPFLNKTYGIIVYQEQIIMIANKFAGYSLAEADLLRRAVSKKELKTLNDERVRFVSKCKKKGYSERDANEIYDYIVKFANYGFNRSHSVAYAMIAYQCAWMKVKYPTYYLTVLLDSVKGSESLTKRYLNEAREKGIEVLPPCINNSEKYYKIEDKKIRLPFMVIKNLGGSTVDKLLEVRKGTLFKDYLDLVSRTRGILNSKTITNLIYSSALDVFGLNKAQMIDKLNDAIKYTDYGSLIGDLKFDYGNSDEYTMAELIDKEKSALGFNLKYHFMYQFYPMIKERNLNRLTDRERTRQISFIAKINNIKEILTRNSKRMAFIAIEDDTDLVDAVIFPDTYEKHSDILAKDRAYLFTAVTSSYKGKTNLEIRDIERI